MAPGAADVDPLALARSYGLLGDVAGEAAVPQAADIVRRAWQAPPACAAMAILGRDRRQQDRD